MYFAIAFRAACPYTAPMQKPESILRDTIYAFATAPGKAGVAIVRISGAMSLPIATLLGVKPLTPRVAQLAIIRDPANGEMIDQAVCLYFPAPHSFTGEDVLEIQLHGGLAIRTRIIAVLAAISGVRMAEPGEYARRAYMAGKMDLTEIEGLSDLIDAETHQQLRQATRQMRGDHKAHFEGLRRLALESLALLEAYIDFPDEEIPESVIQAVTERVSTLQASISAMLSDNNIGERIRSGIEIVLTGAPNAGKSSLLNALVGRDVAIVHESAGTTRDMVEVALEIEGYPVTLVDTAGLREAEHAVEQEGIRRGKARAEQADLVVHLIDVSETESISANKVKIDENTFIVFTKADLAKTGKIPPSALAISTLSGDGIDAFLAMLKERVALLMQSHTPPMITRARHRGHLQKAGDALTRFDIEDPLELACEELRHAAFHIGNITGKIAVDDVLDVIFKQFCIGK